LASLAKHGLANENSKHEEAGPPDHNCGLSPPWGGESNTLKSGDLTSHKTLDTIVQDPQVLDVDNLSWATQGRPDALGNFLYTPDLSPRNDGSALYESSNETLCSFEPESQQHQWTSDGIDPLFVFDEIETLGGLGTYGNTCGSLLSRDQSGSAPHKYNLSQAQGTITSGQLEHVSLPRPFSVTTEFGHPILSRVQKDSDRIQNARYS
jgi:hypothetical protein